MKLFEMFFMRILELIVRQAILYVKSKGNICLIVNSEKICKIIAILLESAIYQDP